MTPSIMQNPNSSSSPHGSELYAMRHLTIPYHKYYVYNPHSVVILSHPEHEIAHPPLRRHLKAAGLLLSSSCMNTCPVLNHSRPRGPNISPASMLIKHNYLYRKYGTIFRAIPMYVCDIRSPHFRVFKHMNGHNVNRHYEEIRHQAEV